MRPRWPPGADGRVCSPAVHVRSGKKNENDPEGESIWPRGQLPGRRDAP
jgi:hypothetical protein